jgi:alkanesulfonate monooxygenase SsuD/methylene tetrahydromethanopterin reductase-like flavin-dependent oxidoreductase (luciferase family)
VTVRIGYKASAEQFAPRELLEFSVEAEDRGLDIVAVSDHFQPWRHHGGHAPSALTWLGAVGEATSSAVLATSVLTSTLRYHPSIVAQAFGTLGALDPGRVILGIGSGEAMNETPTTGEEFPGPKERRMRMAELITLMRRLRTEDRVDFEDEYYRASKATIYDRPEQPVPIYIAARTRRTPASSSPTTRPMSSTASGPTSTSASTTSSSTARAATSGASSSSSPPMCCRRCASGPTAGSRPPPPPRVRHDTDARRPASPRALRRRLPAARNRTGTDAQYPGDQPSPVFFTIFPLETAGGCKA